MWAVKDAVWAFTSFMWAATSYMHDMQTLFWILQTLCGLSLTKTRNEDKVLTRETGKGKEGQASKIGNEDRERRNGNNTWTQD